eukprot:206440_1
MNSTEMDDHFAGIDFASLQNPNEKIVKQYNHEGLLRHYSRYETDINYKRIHDQNHESIRTILNHTISSWVPFNPGPNPSMIHCMDNTEHWMIQTNFKEGAKNLIVENMVPQKVFLQKRDDPTSCYLTTSPPKVNMSRMKLLILNFQNNTRRSEASQQNHLGENKNRFIVIIQCIHHRIKMCNTL